LYYFITFIYYSLFINYAAGVENNPVVETVHYTNICQYRVQTIIVERARSLAAKVCVVHQDVVMVQSYESLINVRSM